jgi:hypothetical protein
MKISDKINCPQAPELNRESTERLVEKEWTDKFKLFHETKQIMKSQFVQNNKEMDVPPRNLWVTPHFRSVLYAAVAECFISKKFDFGLSLRY